MTRLRNRCFLLLAVLLAAGVLVISPRRAVAAPAAASGPVTAAQAQHLLGQAKSLHDALANSDESGAGGLLSSAELLVDVCKNLNVKASDPATTDQKVRSALNQVDGALKMMENSVAISQMQIISSRQIITSMRSELNGLLNPPAQSQEQSADLGYDKPTVSKALAKARKQAGKTQASLAANPGGGEPFASVSADVDSLDAQLDAMKALLDNDSRRSVMRKAFRGVRNTAKVIAGKICDPVFDEEADKRWNVLKNTITDLGNALKPPPATQDDPGENVQLVQSAGQAIAGVETYSLSLATPSAADQEDVKILQQGLARLTGSLKTLQERAAADEDADLIRKAYEQAKADHQSAAAALAAAAQRDPAFKSEWFDQLGAQLAAMGQELPQS